MAKIKPFNQRKRKMLKAQYQNGNAEIELFHDGSRIISYPDDEPLKLNYPLNIDIRLSNRCPLGWNPKTQKATCSFCHESARTDGEFADLSVLQEILDKQIPPNMAIELAVGVNEMCSEIRDFFMWANQRGFVINATVNQLTVSSQRNSTQMVLDLIHQQVISGLGLSFRSLDHFHKIPSEIIAYPHTVVHVIAGIDNIDEIKALSKHGVKKILVLGEKNFGFNTHYFHDESRLQNRQIWLQRISELFPLFDVISFDNLGVEQMQMKRFFKQEADWNTLYQGEHSFYINAVEQYFSPSSRNSMKIPFHKMTIADFFQNIVEKP